MSISILNRGASRGLKPELTVTAPAGSTIDLLQNGIIVATYAIGADETEHTFVVRVGTYTVRGTLGTDTKRVDVAIDTIGQYTVKIEYTLWLYREGDECEDITGGWVAKGLGFDSSFVDPKVPALTKNATNMVVSRTESSMYACGIICPQNTIDFTEYKTINAVVDVPYISANNNCIVRGYFIKDSLGAVCQDGTAWFTFNNSNSNVSNKTVSGDISACNGLFIPYVALYALGSVTIHKIWLE